MRRRKAQKGTTTVEFAVIGTAMFLVLFGVIEVARAMFVWNALTESTRRGARVAAVCPIDHAAIANVAVFKAADGSGEPVVGGLGTGNVSVSYLDEDGNPGADFKGTRFVQVTISGYQHTMAIPFIWPTLDAPAFSTTLPRESLGEVPGATKQCYGTAS